MTPIGEVKQRSSVEIFDSCNCNQCCPRSCCWPRRVVHHKPKREDTKVSPQQFTRTHTVSMPILTNDGQWEVEIDGVRHVLKADAVGQSIVTEHGGK